MAFSRISRRRFLRVLGAGALVSGSWGGFPAQAGLGPCPGVRDKLVRFIVPFSHGGGFDVYARLIEPFYEKAIGAQIVIDNAPGGGGIVGAIKVKKARADGLTQGILNAPGLLVAALTGETQAPNPAKDFTILGRVARDQEVWVTGADSPFQTMEDLLKEAQRRHILCGISEVGSESLVDFAVSSRLLGMRIEFIAGFAGSREASLAAVRGEVDVLAYSFRSMLGWIEAGDLRPILQISVQRIAPHPSLEGVPLLGGDNGLAARCAAELGRDVKEAQADAATLADLIGGGRVVAAPLGLDESLFRCLEEKLHQALTDPVFKAAVAKAQLSLEVARADAAVAELKAAAERAGKFMPIVKAAIKKAQG